MLPVKCHPQSGGAAHFVWRALEKFYAETKRSNQQCDKRLDSIRGCTSQHILQNGLYAVFDNKGLNTDNSISNTFWKPGCQIQIRFRQPHFEVLCDKYKNTDPTSEEAIG
jgi:hypothetical protein